MRGLTVSPEQMQRASNEVAVRVLTDIANGVPLTIEHVATKDATAVGDTLFQVLGAGDTAFASNAAWSGAILFTPLGSDQSWRMFSSGNAGAVDTLDDWKNLIFAYDSFAAAMRYASSHWTSYASDACSTFEAIWSLPNTRGFRPQVR